MESWQGTPFSEGGRNTVGSRDSRDPILLALAVLIVAVGSWLTGEPSPAYAQTAQSPRERVSFNADWRFQKEDPPDVGGVLAWDKIKDRVGATGGYLTKQPGGLTGTSPEVEPGVGVSFVQPGYDDSGWRKLDLPHDWGIEGPFRQEHPGNTGKLPWWGVGWYRKHFRLDAGDSGRRIFADFDGAMSYAVVWLNGRFVGGWPYGYSSFRLDLTPFASFGGDNTLVVRLENPPESSRWYPGGGIYRNVWLVKTAPVHVAHWGTFVTTPEVSGTTARVDVSVRIDNRSDADATVTAVTQVYALDPAGRRPGRPVASSQRTTVPVRAGGSDAVRASVTVAKPRLWSVRSPSLYAAVTSLEQAGKVIDSYETAFGIRTVRFDAASGFLLNGERVPLNGVCNHHDLGALGSAINARALERQVELLKEMGGNAIRTSHNPPAPELIEICDRLGVVLMVEAFDCWRAGKTRNDYHLLFEDWHEKDLRAMVRRDRDHPSVVLWSIGNEIREQRGEAGLRLSAELAAIVRDEDPTRPVTAGCNNIDAGYNGFQKTVDVFGYNYKPAEYRKFREQNPSIPIAGAETSSCVSTRGEYFFPVSDNKDHGRADFQVSSYDLYAPPWAWPPDVEWKGLDENPFVAGEFVWTGFDYLGEPTPYNRDVTNLLNFTNGAAKERMERELKELGKIRVPSRSSYFGILDLAGFRKDRFFIYQARWRPDLPMVHILPHWNWPERVGQVTPVHVYSSGDEVELFLNGKSLGRKQRAALEYRFRWNDLIYEPGELRAVAYRKGSRWAEESVRTTGAAAKLLMQADRPAIRADGVDLSFVTVSITDRDGLLVPRSQNLVRFEVTGPGDIAAVDNGDPTSFEPFQARERKAFNGLCLVIVRSRRGEAGAITLTASSDGLDGRLQVIQSGR